MLCPKCGQEYEGSECPRCSGPKIVVNNSDYLRRKKAYEEKQADKKSASSDMTNAVFEDMVRNMSISKANDTSKTSNNQYKDENNISKNKKNKGAKKATESSFGKDNINTHNEKAIVNNKSENEPDAIDIMKQKSAKAVQDGIDKIRKITSSKDKSKKKDNSAQATSDENDMYLDDSKEDIIKNADIRKRDMSHTFKGINKKKLKSYVLSIVAILVVVVTAFAIYRFAIRKNYQMYMSSERGIYDVSKLETEYICDTSSAIFAADKKTFFTPNIPSDIEKNNIISTLASDSGKYFTATTYDSESQKYAVYIFDENSCLKISDNTKVKSVKYITDTGKLIYTDYEEARSGEEESESDSNNIEGGVTNINLYEYVIDTSSKSDVLQGKQQLIDDNIQNVNIYTNKNVLICLDKDNSLYLYNYEKMDKKTGIADDVSYVYVMSDETQNLYTYHSDEVNQLKSATGFVYSINNVCYYHEITEKEVTNKTVDADNTDDFIIAKAVGSTLQFVYEKDSYCYMINSGKLSYAKVNGKVMGDYNKIAQLGSMMSLVYIPSEEQLVFINSDGNLVYAKKGDIKNITENVLEGSLSLVVNSDKGVTYIKDNSRYYIASVSDNEVKLSDDVTASSARVVFYKNKLYFYKEDGVLYTCSHKGKELNQVGNVEWFWLGSR